MDVRNCRKCGRVFNYSVGPIICPGCKEAQEVKFQDVKEYIAEHPGCGISEVAEECEVSPQQIKQWLREERLEFASDSAVGLECEKCGATIRSGRFCERCKTGLAQELGGVYKKNPEPSHSDAKAKKEGARMRYLDN